MKNRKPRSAFPGLSLELSSRLPIIEFTGNRRVLIEGSTGVIRYESEVVSINTRSMVITLNGRGLTLKSIAPTSVIVDGIITDTRFES